MTSGWRSHTQQFSWFITHYILKEESFLEGVGNDIKILEIKLWTLGHILPIQPINDMYVFITRSTYSTFTSFQIVSFFFNFLARPKKCCQYLKALIQNHVKTSREHILVLFQILKQKSFHCFWHSYAACSGFSIYEF